MPRSPRQPASPRPARRRRRTSAWCAWLLAAGAPAAPAQPAQEAPPVDLAELSLEELMAVPVETVYSASLRRQATVEAPSSVTIVTAREIEAQGWRTLADLLRGVRSFFVTDDRNYEHVGVRGFNPLGDFNSRVLLLVDGHRINNSVYDSAPIGLEFPLDVDLIERVEIIRGPGSSLYGSNAFFGVIHVMTRRGADVGGLETSAEGGSFGSWRGRATWGGEVGPGIDLLVSGTAFDAQGDDLFYPEYAADPTGGRTHGTDFERGYSLFARAGFKSWRLESAWASREKGIPTGSYGTVYDDPDNRTVDAQGYVDLSGEQPLSAQWTVGGRVHYDHFYYRGTYIYDDSASGGPSYLEGDDRSDGAAIGAALTASTTALAGHRVTAGVEYRHDLRTDQSYEDDVASYLDDGRDRTVLGVFAQDEVRLAERWSLNAGLRYDRYSTFGGTLNPRAGLIWNPDEASAFKLLYGQAFRAPNAYELYYGDGGGTQKPNPDLDPETIRTWELVHERRFGGAWRAAASLFHYEIDDLILLTVDPADGLLVFRNTSEVVADGVEIEGEHVRPGGLRLLGSYSWQQVEDRTTRDEPPNSPEHLVKLAAEAPLFADWLLAGVELQWMDERGTLAGDETGDFALVNVTLRTRELAHGMRFSVTVRNLFDAGYSDPGSAEHRQDRIEQDGRTFLVRLSCRF